MDVEKLLKQLEGANTLIATLVPTVGAIGGIVRIIAKAVRPTDAKKAQGFDAAIAELDAALPQLRTSLDDYQRIRAEILEEQKRATAPVPGMEGSTSGSGG